VPVVVEVAPETGAAVALAALVEAATVKFSIQELVLLVPLTPVVEVAAFGKEQLVVLAVLAL
jgi:hypothetical protein